ncbi:helix-turn-helix domain-containing protein [Hydrobacter penzbergensis]|jgi:transcriptional regulator with XRE-family HTH domain|nr:helix-turn-helix transcriptional regulator [Hydrobacter penzbergensis]
MSLADSIKNIREEKHLMQKEVATHIGVDKSTYSKIEKGLRELTVAELQKIAQLFNMTTDQLLNYDGDMPQEVVLEDKTAVEQMRLIQQLDDEDKKTIFKLIDKMLTNKKFKDFFQKNVALM